MVKTHSSKWFTYQKKVKNSFRACCLLIDLPFSSTKTDQSVTFHNDEKCVKGAIIDLIIETNNNLVGWIKDEIVMDINF